jgi:hyaluronan synthase
MLKSILNYFKKHNINSWIIFYCLVYIILVIKVITIEQLNNGTLFGVYSIVVSFYILSRFGLAYFYDHEPAITNYDYEPTVTFAVPAKNEGVDIRETMLRIANSDYPHKKFEIIAINDGSTDETLDQMLAASKEINSMGIKTRVIDWKVNKGKREGMACCVKESENDIIIFIDSDSFVQPDTIRELVKYFTDEKVGAVAGHAYVTNENENMITKMQSVRYFVAFKAYKAAESIFGNVTCCSGCCSAYRRTHVNEVIDKWLEQRFLGVQCTYGDDRSLTNYLLRGGV